MRPSAILVRLVGMAAKAAKCFGESKLGSGNKDPAAGNGLDWPSVVGNYQAVLILRAQEGGLQRKSPFGSLLILVFI